MRKLLLSTALLATTALVTSNVMAAFTSTATIEDNLFQTGTLELQISPDGTSAWATTQTALWSTPTSWAPGDVYSDVAYFRNHGTIDAESLTFDMSDLVNSNLSYDLSLYVNVDDAWYDSNGNGIFDSGERIRSALISTYDANLSYGNNDGVVTLAEMYAGMTAGALFELEPGSDFLPGADAAVKGLYIDWELDTTVPNALQGENVAVDFDFTATNS